MEASSSSLQALHLNAVTVLTWGAKGEHTLSHKHTITPSHTAYCQLVHHSAIDAESPLPHLCLAVLLWWAPPLCSCPCCSPDSTPLSLPCTACRRNTWTQSTGITSSDWTNSPTSRCSASWPCRSEFACSTLDTHQLWRFELVVGDRAVHTCFVSYRKFWPVWVSVLGEQKQVSFVMLSSCTFSSSLPPV